MSSGQTQVLRQLEGGWLQCQDDQGVFFYNSVTKQSSDEVPPELRAAAAPVQVPQQQAAAAAAPQAQVLRELAGGWLQCQDDEGVYYYNKNTQQACDEMPPELGGAAAPENATQVLRELGGGWLQCQNEQGVYYFNHVTQQSSDEMPPELRAAAAPQVQPKAAAAAPVTSAAPQVLRELGGGWLQCRDDKGVFYYNQETQQSSDEAPAEFRVAAKPSVSVQPQSSAYAQPQPAQKPVYTQQAQMPANQVKLKEQIGEWMICEDAQGEFYKNARTQQQFDQPPAELVQIYKLAQQQKQLAAQRVATKQTAVQQPAAQQQMQAQQQLLQQQMQYQSIALKSQKQQQMMYQAPSSSVGQHYYQQQHQYR